MGTLDWRFFDSSVTPVDAVTPIQFEVWIENGTADSNDFYKIAEDEFAPSVVGGIRQSEANSQIYLTIADEVSTSRIEFRLLNVENFGSEYFLNELRFDGHAPESQIVVPVVDFLTWLFDASLTANENATSRIEEEVFFDNDGTYVELCPVVTPIHGLMFRGFSRTWINAQLAEGHLPFINAIRNICLSPFYIAIVLIGILFLAYLFAFIMEWFLMKLDLYRENPYAKVPLVTATCAYDVSEHETAPDAYGQSTAMQHRESYKSPSMADGSNADLLTMQKSTDREAIEMNMVNNVRNTLRGKQAPPGLATNDSQSSVSSSQQQAGGGKRRASSKIMLNL